MPIEPKTKKNHQQIIKVHGRNIVVPSKEYTKYERESISYLPLSEKPIDCPVNVKCYFYMKTHRRVDLVNLLQAVSDMLVKAGILEDDNSKIIVSYDGSRVYYDKENPRTVIFIKEEV